MPAALRACWKMSAAPRGRRKASKDATHERWNCTRVTGGDFFNMRVRAEAQLPQETPLP